MKQKRTARLEFRCTEEEKKAISELAKYLEIPDGTLVRNLVLASYEDAMVFKKIGLLKGLKEYKKFKEAYKQLFETSQIPIRWTIKP